MSLTKLVSIPNGINPGLSSARQSTMLSLLGNPRSFYNQNCLPVTNPNLKPMIVFRDMGPFKVNGLKPAVDSLGEVLKEIQQSKPNVYAALGTAGMLCARYQRNSSSAISNHSWGTAIDLNLNGILDTRGDGKVQAGLVEIFPIFNSHGWYWGAAFGKEDGMHFECSEQLIRSWAGKGLLTGQKQKSPKPLLTIGDRGPEVKELQQLLNRALGAQLDTDGIFGHGTFAAVVAFQGSKGLAPDGAVGTKTWGALGA